MVEPVQVGSTMIFGRLPTPGPRAAFVERLTRETQIRCEVDLDGVGRSSVHTPLGFLTHMLEAFARHAHVDLSIHVVGDLEVDQHHTVEDTGLVLGEALRSALGDRRGIWRTANVEFPMDETRAACAVDLSGRPYLVFNAEFTRDHVGALATDLVIEFFQALTTSLAANVHLRLCCGHNDHHRVEALFKAFARAFELAAAVHPRAAAEIPSTKGALVLVGRPGGGAKASGEVAGNAQTPAARLVQTTSGGFSLDELEEAR